MIWPRKPSLKPEHEREFERIGIEDVRYRLASNRGGQHLLRHPWAAVL